MYFYKTNSIYKDEKICICTLGKEENKYIREYVQHYKDYGIDKIFLYDNNDINGENFEEEINDYISEGFVEIFNWRGKSKVIYDIMNECYYRNNKKYDWILFFEIDEFIHLYNFTNVKYFLKEKKFDQCQVIYLNLVIHTDNNQLYYYNDSLFERFPNIFPKNKSHKLQVKMIIKGNIKDIKIINTAHCNISNNNYSLKTCNGFGNEINIRGMTTNKTDFRFNYIDHFFCKSTEEFVHKLAKGDALLTKKKELDIYNIQRIKRYFTYNEITMEKIEMLEKGLKLNLSRFKRMIKKFK